MWGLLLPVAQLDVGLPFAQLDVGLSLLTAVRLPVAFLDHYQLIVKYHTENHLGRQMA